MYRHLLMSKKERERQEAFSLVKQGYLTLKEAGQRLDISYRQVLRIWQRYQRHGLAGILHHSRGKPSNRCLSEDYYQQILSYYKQHLLDFEPTFASEKLAQANLPINRETLRRLLIKHNLWHKKSRKTAYHPRRPRRTHFGELLQLDGSFHDWLGNGSSSCLMNLVDDATSITLAQLHQEETTEAAIRVLWAWITKYGIPKAIYTDRKTVYVTEREPTLEEQLHNIEPLTTFGQCCKRLGIHIIKAYSPQAKGRVERSHGTYQDRFVKELKFQSIKTILAANKLLAHDFCDNLNKRFALPIVHDAHRPLSKDTPLYDIFTWREQRQLSNDHTLRFNNQFYQLKKSTYPRLKPKTQIMVHTHIDGKVSLHKDNYQLNYDIIDKPTCKPLNAKPALSPTQRCALAKKASQHSPWRNMPENWLASHK